ncbi:Rv3654c family TadE-like protein [Sinomonas susongensis]|uniref:Rv3654c family TadE-like protein n=1 Tax=Sinomonas susongensis TaxID=1324851 RepID=UPI0011081005|nr:Rv3654c family TadE-like protein [Sinomonas susongensis]
MTAGGSIAASGAGGPASETEAPSREAGAPTWSAPTWCKRSERGAGTILALALALAAVSACSAAVLVSQGIVAGERTARAADLTALAAADAERGLSGGGTCVSAEEVAMLNAARVISCEIEVPGSIVRVVVRGEKAVAGVHAEGRARAGQPP